MKERLAQELQAQKDKALTRELHPVESRSGKHIVVNGSPYLNFVSNDYLGISQDPHIQKRSQEYLEKYGTSSSGSRLLGGNYNYQTELESTLARFKNKERALLFNSGYNANLAIASTFASKQTHLFCDKWNHASIYDGIRQSQGTLHRYKHRDMQQLDELLGKYGPEKIVLTESLFSMDGDMAPLEEIAFLCKKHGALLFVDEAHAEPIYGDEGRGLIFEQDIAPQVDLVLGAFGKGYGAFGSYVAGSELLIETLIHKARSFIYTTALPPAAIGAMRGALEVARAADEQREHLKCLARYLKQNLQIKGWDTLTSESHIVPLLVGENQKSVELQNFLKERGLWVQCVREPTVPKGTARLRLNVNAYHDYADLDVLLQALEEWK